VRWATVTGQTDQMRSCPMPFGAEQGLENHRHRGGQQVGCFPRRAMSSQQVQHSSDI